MVNKVEEATFHDRRLDDDKLIDREKQSKFYWATEEFDQQLWHEIERRAAGKHVLEIGCFDGRRTLEVAEVAAQVTAIDISPLAIRLTRERAQQKGLKNVSLLLADAEVLGFDNNYFDLIFGTGVLHHVDTAKTIAEIWRVLKPGGVAIFREPLGHNPIVNLYRQYTPEARTVGEHPLLAADLHQIKCTFLQMEITYFGFFSLAAVPFRAFRFGRTVLSILCQVDDFVFNNRILGRFCWQANLFLYK